VRWPAGSFDPALLGRTDRTALFDSELSGWAEITHPFHPFLGQRFKILKTRCCSGIETLILKELSRGSFAIPVDWTDRGIVSACPEKYILDFNSLAELTEFVGNCKKPKRKVIDK
jgi:hypothetical protein